VLLVFQKSLVVKIVVPDSGLMAAEAVATGGGGKAKDDGGGFCFEEKKKNMREHVLLCYSIFF